MTGVIPYSERTMTRTPRPSKNSIEFFEGRGVRVTVLSEYGITPVIHSIHLNRLFRQRGWLAIKEELDRELLDCGASKAFAVADHQIAHVYVNDPAIRSDVHAF